MGKSPLHQLRKILRSSVCVCVCVRTRVCVMKEGGSASAKSELEAILGVQQIHPPFLYLRTFVQIARLLVMSAGARYERQTDKAGPMVLQLAVWPNGEGARLRSGRFQVRPLARS